MMQRFTEGWVLGSRLRFALLLWLSGLVLDASRLMTKIGISGFVILPGAFRLSSSLSQAALRGWRRKRAARPVNFLRSRPN